MYHQVLRVSSLGYDGIALKRICFLNKTESRNIVEFSSITCILSFVVGRCSIEAVMSSLSLTCFVTLLCANFFISTLSIRSPSTIFTILQIFVSQLLLSLNYVLFHHFCLIFSTERFNRDYIVFFVYDDRTGRKCS